MHGKSLFSQQFDSGMIDGNGLGKLPPSRIESEGYVSKGQKGFEFKTQPVGSVRKTSAFGQSDQARDVIHAENMGKLSRM